MSNISKLGIVASVGLIAYFFFREMPALTKSQQSAITPTTLGGNITVNGMSLSTVDSLPTISFSMLPISRTSVPTPTVGIGGSYSCPAGYIAMLDINTNAPVCVPIQYATGTNNFGSSTGLIITGN